MILYVVELKYRQMSVVRYIINVPDGYVPLGYSSCRVRLSYKIVNIFGNAYKSVHMLLRHRESVLQCCECASVMRHLWNWTF